MSFIPPVKHKVQKHSNSHFVSNVSTCPPSETHTPQRKGLRSSALRPKKPEPAKQTGPVVIETWVAEEELDLWEIRAFSERSEGHKGQSCHAYSCHVWSPIWAIWANIK